MKIKMKMKMVKEEILGKREKERSDEQVRVKNYLHRYSNCVYLHGYCSRYAYLQTYTLINVGSFLRKMCKFDHFLYYTHTGVIALMELIKVNI